MLYKNKLQKAVFFNGLIDNSYQYPQWGFGMALKFAPVGNPNSGKAAMFNETTAAFGMLVTGRLL
jgi:hypothetical protein